MEEIDQRSTMGSLLKKALYSCVSFIAFQSELISDLEHEKRRDFLEPQEFSAAIGIAKRNPEYEDFDNTLYTLNLDKLPEGIGRVKLIVNQIGDEIIRDRNDCMGIHVRFRHKQKPPSVIYEEKIAVEQMECTCPECNRTISPGETYWDVRMVDTYCHSCIRKCNPVRGKGLIWLEFEDLFNAAQECGLLPFTFRDKPFSDISQFCKFVKLNILDYKSLDLDLYWLKFAEIQSTDDHGTEGQQANSKKHAAQTRGDIVVRAENETWYFYDEPYPITGKEAAPAFKKILKLLFKSAGKYVSLDEIGKDTGYKILTISTNISRIVSFLIRATEHGISCGLVVGIPNTQPARKKYVKTSLLLRSPKGSGISYCLNLKGSEDTGYVLRNTQENLPRPGKIRTVKKI